MGNGTEASGEGYKFRGRGFIQLTGKDNYTAFGKSINEDIFICVTAKKILKENYRIPRLFSLSFVFNDTIK